MVLSTNDPLEIAAAVLEASIGYHTARSALMHVERYLAAETVCACERCLSCFKGKLREGVERDLRYWQSISEERRRRAREFLKATKDANLLEAMTASMLYPTMW